MTSKSFKGAAEARKSNVSADAICEFYTGHPYPPPVENLDRARDMWQNENVHRAEYHLLWPNKEYRADLDVLVAGCGTWQAAKYALCHPAARVVGIDVSLTSLEQTEALKRKYDLTNLETKQLALESVDDLDHCFDLIICTGVLRMFEAIDGRRSISEIIDKVEGASPLARVFFEKLWWYDQVVFDTSRAQ